MVMREILFRGKRIDNGEWIYGDLRQYSKKHIGIYSFELQQIVRGIDPSTVGQYTGLKDKNGKRIFEGDMFEDRREDMYAVVIFKDGCFRLEWYGITGAWMEYGFDECGGGWGKVECESFDMYHIESFEIIGNIHDNPEVLEGK